MLKPASHFRFALALVLAAIPPLVARADGPVLVVPASKATLHVIANLPEKASGNGGWQLVEIDKPANRLAVQAVAKIAADGTKQGDGGRIVVDVPPGSDAAKTRRFRLEPAAAGPAAPTAFALSDDSKASLPRHPGSEAGLRLQLWRDHRRESPGRRNPPQPGVLHSSPVGPQRRSADRRFSQGPLPSSRRLLGLAARRKSAMRRTITICGSTRTSRRNSSAG